MKSHTAIPVAVEDECPRTALAIDDRAARIAADDIGRGNEIHGVSGSAGPCDRARLGQVERFAILMFGRMPVGPAEGRPGRLGLAQFVVTFHDAEGQPERERWRPDRPRAPHGEPCLGDLRVCCRIGSSTCSSSVRRAFRAGPSTSNASWIMGSFEARRRLAALGKLCAARPRLSIAIHGPVRLPDRAATCRRGLFRPVIGRAGLGHEHAQPVGQLERFMSS